MITNLIIALFLAPLSMMGQEGSFTEGIFRCTIIDEGVVEISSARHDSIVQFLGQDRTLVILGARSLSKPLTPHVMNTSLKLASLALSSE